MVLKTKEENRTNAQYKPLRLRVELVHLFPLVVQKLSSLIITEFTKYKSNSLPKGSTGFTSLVYYLIRCSVIISSSTSCILFVFVFGEPKGFMSSRQDDPRALPEQSEAKA